MSVENVQPALTQSEQARQSVRLKTWRAEQEIKSKAARNPKDKRLQSLANLIKYK